MAKAGRKFEVLVLNQIAQVGPEALPAGALRGGARKSRTPDAILVRSQDMHAHGHSAPALKAIGARRRGHQQHPGGGAEQARRAGVQRAGRERQRGEGAGDRRAC